MGQFLAELLVFGTLPFCLFTVSALVLLIYTVETEHPFFATFSLLGFFGILNWAGYPILSSISANPTRAVLYLFVYLAVGTVWAVIKWWIFVKSNKAKYDEWKSDWCKRQGISNEVIPSELIERFKAHMPTSEFVFHPIVSDNKGRIELWILHWPWSFCWTFIDQPVKKACIAIRQFISDWLQKISDNAWRDEI